MRDAPATSSRSRAHVVSTYRKASGHVPGGRPDLRFPAHLRTRLRDVFLLVRRLYLTRVWKMDIHPYTLVSLEPVLDRA